MKYDISQHIEMTHASWMLRTNLSGFVGISNLSLLKPIGPGVQESRDYCMHVEFISIKCCRTPSTYFSVGRGAGWTRIVLIPASLLIWIQLDF